MRSKLGFAAIAAALGLLVLGGCGGTSKYQISGTVSGAVTANVTVTLSGASSATTTTSSAGAFAFAELANGTYTVTPSLSGYTFNPASRTVTISDADVSGVTFTSTPVSNPTYTISGSITGAVTGGVTLTLSGASSATTVTSSAGTYSFANLANGAYTVTPSKTGFTFNPASLSVTVSGADVPNKNFVSTQIANTYIISGTVSGSIAAAVTMNLSGAVTASVTTDNQGGYAFGGLSAGSYTITPVKTGYVFTPAHLDVTVTNANVLNQNFTSAPVTTGYKISGHITGTVVASVTVNLTGAASASTTTDNLGAYEFAGLANGTYTITPTKSLVTFTPASRTVTLTGADLLNQDFVSTTTQVVTVSSNITGPTTWDANHIYEVTTYVSVSSVLTIQPGTIVKFDPAGYLVTSDPGTIVANGTAALPIVFTSIRDDANGGDTNGDGTGTVAKAGDWRGIHINVSGSEFSFAQFLYAGKSDDAALGITASGVSLTVTDSEFGHIKGNATTLDTVTPALDLTGAIAGTVAQRNTFYDDRLPLGISANFSIDDSNVFQKGLGPANVFNGVVVAGCSTLASNITWGVTKVPMILGQGSCDYLTVGSGGKLTLAPGTVVKFLDGGMMYLSGPLVATGTATQPIVFTSIADDLLTDTNGDGTATAPVPGAWRGLSIRANGSTFGYVSMFYGGASNYSLLSIDSSGVKTNIDHSIFAYHLPTTDSLAAPPAVDLRSGVSGTTFTNNTIYASTLPLGISVNMSLDDTNLFNKEGTLPNKYNGVLIDGCSDLTGNIGWTQSKVPFVLGDTSCNYMTISNGAHLTLGAGVVMKFFYNGQLYIESGAVLTQGANFFTSINDDARLGDTNACGGTIEPAANDWAGITVGGTCQTWPNIFYSTPGC